MHLRSIISKWQKKEHIKQQQEQEQEQEERTILPQRKKTYNWPETYFTLKRSFGYRKCSNTKTPIANKTD